MSDTGRDVKVEQDGDVVDVILDRAPVNALSSAMYAELNAVFDQLAARQDVAVVVLRSSSPRTFCAGADLREVAPGHQAGVESFAERRQRLARQAFASVVGCPVPTIAVLNGWALGAGAVLASCCDIRYASHSAKVGLPEITVGRAGGTRHLMRHMPQGLVRELAFTGQALTAQEAHQAGFLTRIFPDGEELDASRALARQIARQGVYALRLMKEALNGAEPLPLEEGYLLEQQYTLRLALRGAPATAAAAPAPSESPQPAPAPANG